MVPINFYIIDVSWQLTWDPSIESRDIFWWFAFGTDVSGEVPKTITMIYILIP